MEFKARKIEIVADNPYTNDKLSRKDNIDKLSLLLRNFSTPIVLSINAPWGYGKTTFLEMLHADLINNGCNSIYFSAWETDFATDPLLAFLGEMNQGIEPLIKGDKKKSEAWNKAKKAGSHILKRGVPVLLKVGTAGIVDVDKIIEDETSKFVEGISQDVIAEYSNNKDEIKSFKKHINKILNIDDKAKNKLFIFVDELDRCKPTYAIELLERIKHLLDIEGLVFVLALDKQQLAHSVKGVYGYDFEAIGYLKRFIDIEYNLPTSDLSSFIDQLYNTFKFKEFFEKRTEYRAFRYETEHLRNVFKMLISEAELSLRDVEHIFAKMNLVIHSTKEGTHLYPPLLAILLVVKELKPEIYKEYTQEESTPEKMIEYLYSLFSNGNYTESFECALVEGYLIAAKSNSHNSKLGTSLSKHKEFLEDDKCSEQQREYSDRVIAIAKKPTDLGSSVVLNSIVSRIEMTENFEFSV
ncbi:MAG: P-loop NTPase fold protein [Desulfobacteraceae bacterium]|jgi:hypothetical protein|nr:P-loop NTPase fold protein [Desulfobacteraceae bacterium]